MAICPPNGIGNIRRSVSRFLEPLGDAPRKARLVRDDLHRGNGLLRAENKTLNSEPSTLDGRQRTSRVSKCPPVAGLYSVLEKSLDCMECVVAHAVDLKPSSKINCHINREIYREVRIFTLSRPMRIASKARLAVTSDQKPHAKEQRFFVRCTDRTANFAGNNRDSERHVRA